MSLAPYFPFPFLWSVVLHLDVRVSVAPFLVGRGRLRKLVSAEGLAFALFDLLLERADGVYGEPLEHTLGDEERDLPDTETRPRDE